MLKHGTQKIHIYTEHVLQQKKMIRNSTIFSSFYTINTGTLKNLVHCSRCQEELLSTSTQTSWCYKTQLGSGFDKITKITTFQLL